MVSLHYSKSAGLGANVFVTGANRGLGLGLVKVLLKSPGVKRVFAACRQPEQASALHDLKKSHPEFQIVQLDVRCDDSIKQASGHISTAVGSEGLNLIVNNGAIFETKGTSVEDVDREAFLRHFNVNSVSVAVLNAAFLPLVRKAASAGGPARIINISSDLGSVQMTTNCAPDATGDTNVVYGMSKAALNLYTRALAGNEKTNGIVAMAIHPGWVQTDMGGSEARLTVEESTTAIIDIVSRATLEHAGWYVNWAGEQMPF